MERIVFGKIIFAVIFSFALCSISVQKQLPSIKPNYWWKICLIAKPQQNVFIPCAIRFSLIMQNILELLHDKVSRKVTYSYNTLETKRQSKKLKP